jgi:hypothetical protein
MCLNTVKTGISALVVVLLSGCALIPDSVRPEIEHMSHATQHEPCTDHPTNYGVNIASVMLHWDLPHAYLEVGDGLALNRPNTSGGYGEVWGPREQFTARVGLIIPIRQ